MICLKWGFWRSWKEFILFFPSYFYTQCILNISFCKTAVRFSNWFYDPASKLQQYTVYQCRHLIFTSFFLKWKFVDQIRTKGGEIDNSGLLNGLIVKEVFRYINSFFKLKAKNCRIIKSLIALGSRWNLWKVIFIIDTLCNSTAKATCLLMYDVVKLHYSPH